MATDVAGQAAKWARDDARVIAVVMDLKRIHPRARSAVLNAARKAYHRTWTELGHVGPDGQTDAGVRAELMIAMAITNIVESALRE